MCRSLCLQCRVAFPQLCSRNDIGIDPAAVHQNVVLRRDHFIDLLPRKQRISSFCDTCSPSSSTSQVPRSTSDIASVRFDLRYRLTGG